MLLLKLASTIPFRTMENAEIISFIEAVKIKHPRAVRGILESRLINPEKFDRIASMFLNWANQALGVDATNRLIDDYAGLCHQVNIAQYHYEERGTYLHKSFQVAYDEVYGQKEMENYLWGLYISNVLWAHHMEICLFFEDRFLPRIPQGANIIDIAPGHGGWGLWALSKVEESTLHGYDISPSSLEISTKLAKAANLSERSTYELEDALNLGNRAEASAEVVISCLLLEHLEHPEQLLKNIEHLLKPNGIAFVLGALTAAQSDHIYEFRRESELVLMCEQSGLRVLETLSANPKKGLAGAKFVPRTMALFVQKQVLQRTKNATIFP